MTATNRARSGHRPLAPSEITLAEVLYPLGGLVVFGVAATAAFFLAANDETLQCNDPPSGRSATASFTTFSGIGVVDRPVITLVSKKPDGSVYELAYRDNTYYGIRSANPQVTIDRFCESDNVDLWDAHSLDGRPLKWMPKEPERS